MTAQVRPYNHEHDYERVNQFLIDTYAPVDGKYSNWLQPRWEYMHYHSNMDQENMHKIGVWEDDGRMVALVTYEMQLGQVFFALHPDYPYLKEEMLDYAEENLKGYNDKKGCPYMAAYVNEFDEELKALVQARGYDKREIPEYFNCSRFDIPNPFPAITLPEGFKVQSLAEENDLRLVNRVLYRGFNHEGEAPEEYIEGRGQAQEAPNYRKDLNMVVVAPNGNYVAYAGLWYVPEHKLLYVEPCATDPDYRRMGLGKAALMEGIRRGAELGAEIAIVESGIDYYLALGFKPVFARYPWVQYF